MLLAMLPAGCGNMAEAMAGSFATATPEQCATTQDDWHRHRDRLLADIGDWWLKKFSLYKN